MSLINEFDQFIFSDFVILINSNISQVAVTGIGNNNHESDVFTDKHGFIQCQFHNSHIWFVDSSVIVSSFVFSLITGYIDHVD